MWRGEKKLYFEYVMCFASWRLIQEVINTLCHQPRAGNVSALRFTLSFLNIQTNEK